MKAAGEAAAKTEKGVDALLTGMKADVNLGGTANIFKLEEAAQKISQDVGLVPALQKLAKDGALIEKDEKLYASSGASGPETKLFEHAAKKMRDVNAGVMAATSEVAEMSKDLTVSFAKHKSALSKLGTKDSEIENKHLDPEWLKKDEGRLSELAEALHKMHDSAMQAAAWQAEHVPQPLVPTAASKGDVKSMNPA